MRASVGAPDGWAAILQGFSDAAAA